MVGGAFAVFMILSASFDWSPYINDLHFLAKANLLFVIAVVVNVVVSLTSGKIDEQKVAEYTYKRSFYNEETEQLKGLPWYKNYRTLSVILLIITAIFVGMFW